MMSEAASNRRVTYQVIFVISWLGFGIELTSDIAVIMKRDELTKGVLKHCIVSEWKMII
jgi:hypothetical protein